MIYTALDTFYVSDEQLRQSPSRKDGVDEETENMLRLYGCEMIQESGILLELPQAVMATGQVLFHRFYCKKSFTRFNVKRVAASCVWLAAKLEESPRKIRDVLNVFHRMECRRDNLPLQILDITSKAYEEMKLDIIRTERHLLKEMGFICHVEHPHKFVLNYLLQLDASPDLIQEGWSLANDSLRTTLCVRFKSEVVACGVVYAAARRFRVPLPENPPWWLAFQAGKAEIDEVCRVLALLYRQPKARYIEVCKEAKSFVLTTKGWDPPQPVAPPVQPNGPATEPFAAEQAKDLAIEKNLFEASSEKSKQLNKDKDDREKHENRRDKERERDRKESDKRDRRRDSGKHYKERHRPY